MLCTPHKFQEPRSHLSSHEALGRYGIHVMEARKACLAELPKFYVWDDITILTDFRNTFLASTSRQKRHSIVLLLHNPFHL